VKRIALIGRLKPGAEEEAVRLIEAGPPFDPGERGFDRHVVYVSAGEVVFVFEGQEVEWLVDELVNEPEGGTIPTALAAWRDLVDGEPRIARAAYAWDR
jgi:hypothetical protein